MEFKVLDGTSGKIARYLSEGMLRFVEGRYSGSCGEAAMCALLRKTGAGDVLKIEAKIQADATQLNCHPPSGLPFFAPSKLAPGLAKFDTVHTRVSPFVNPISLAHVFIALP